LSSAEPSRDIVGTGGYELKGKRLILCVTGSIAAVQAVEIARELMRHGAEVYAVMSQAAQQIIHPYALEWATGRPVITEITGKTEYIELVGKHLGKADLLLIAPATLNTISKIATGVCDTTVTTFALTALGSRMPVVVCPAMHESLYDHQIMRDNIERLRALGFEFVNPRLEEGKAKIASTQEIVERVLRRLGSCDMVGWRVLVAAGPTYEHIDPVRIITNKSSGKMGVAVVEEALSRGAEVTLVYGPGYAAPPSDARVIRVETTEEMRTTVVSELKAINYDLVVMVAAAADYTPETPYDYKLSTDENPNLTLKLRATSKIVDEVKKLRPECFLVVFRAVYNLSEEAMVEDAYNRLRRSNADLIVVNDVSRWSVGFGVDSNEVVIIDGNREAVRVPLSSKREIAGKILDCVLRLRGRREGG
jgi:phosphopantothenoylcysteine decarboxylase/phosphopantothenate--cysteine ligase